MRKLLSPGEFEYWLREVAGGWDGWKDLIDHDTIQRERIAELEAKVAELECMMDNAVKINKLLVIEALRK